MINIYHNPRCRKSREAVEYLVKKKVTFKIIEYLKTPMDKKTIKNLLLKLKLKPFDLIRKNEIIWKNNYKNKELTSSQLISVMLINPKLIERPIIEDPDKAIIGRPIENLHKFLN